MRSNFGKIIDPKIPVLIDFSAVWCGCCKMLAPILKDVKREMGEGVKIVKIDVDKNHSIASRFHVKGVPTMLLFIGGKELWRQSGVLPKNEIIYVVKSFQ